MKPLTILCRSTFSLRRVFPRCAGSVLVSGLLSLALCPLAGHGQSDNFDSYSTPNDLTAAGWILSSLNPALVTTTFPAVGSGKGLRLQANPVPGTAPAVGLWYRTNDYTDFYIALDIANWPGTDKNEALVLFARMTAASTGTVTTDLNPADAQGVICNYDASQYGENATDRRQGQFQINVVGAGFVTQTIGVAEVTLIPGRSYRLVFKGVGTHYVGQVYDLYDLTRPVVTIEADDSTFAHGACGFLGFSRQGTSGTFDGTVDNYFAGATDPNLAPVPALSHPIVGTPQVVTRTPTNRFTNFYPAANGISFTARTFGSTQINAAATRLYLNGVDVSSALAPLPPNGSTATFTTAAGTLADNTVYAARIELVDTTGALKSTNTFWFDTFSDAYLLMPPVKTVEAEDYNFNNGGFQLDPIPISGVDTNNSQVGGFGSGFYLLSGLPEVDYHKPAGFYNAGFSEYRPDDRVQITQGSWHDESGDIEDANHPNGTRIHDTQRSQYQTVGVYEYQVRLTSPGDWMNYTRAFDDTNYLVFLRCGSFGDTMAYLDRVTSDPRLLDQTTERLGSFNIANHLMRLNYRYEPLMIGGGPAVLHLAGTNTLRLTLAGTDGQDQRKVSLDYLLFVPTSLGPTIFDNFNDGDDTNNPAWDHYDPIGGLTAAPAIFSFPNGAYRIQAPAPQAPDAGPSRAGSFVHGASYGDFYVSVDILDFDDSVRQAFGVAARITTPGLGSTSGYLFSWEPGGGTLPGATNGDLDISVLAGETPLRQIETAPSSLHLERGKSYRFAFMGHGFDFEGQVYELPDLDHPLIRLPGHDDSETYASGLVGLIVASQSSLTVAGDATFDNFLATTAEPRLAVTASGGAITLTWPVSPFRLQSTTDLAAPNWTDVTSGIGTTGLQSVYTVSPGQAPARYFRLVYP